MSTVKVAFKVGDKRTAPGKEHLGIKDGMPVCFWGGSTKYEPRLSDHMKKVFCVVEFPEDWEGRIREALIPNQDQDHIDPKTYRARKSLINFNELESATGIVGLESSLRGSGTVEVLDGSRLSTAILKDSTKLNPAALDANAITSGLYTIGSDVADHYATWALFFADFASPFDGAMTGTQTSDVTETASATITEDLSTYDFISTSSSPHSGDPTSGWITNLNLNNYGFWFQHAGSGDIVVENLKLFTQYNLSATYSTFLVNAGITASGYIKLRDLLIDKNARRGNGIEIADASPIVEVSNVVIWDIGAVAGSHAIRNTVNRTGSIFENISIYSCYYGIDNTNQTNLVYKNIQFFNCTTNFTNNTNSVSTNCGTDAASVGAATNNNAEVNLTVADEVISTDDTNANFMKLKYGGVCAYGGTSVSIAGNTTGIRGNARPGADGQTSIGADEFDTALSESSSSSNVSASSTSVSSNSSESRASSNSSESSNSNSSSSTSTSSASSSTSSSQSKSASSESASSWSEGTAVDCIQARITANIKTALETITVANGYKYNVGAVEEARRFLRVNNRWPFILILKNAPQLNEYLVWDILEYVIWWFPMQDDRLVGNPANASLDLNTEVTYHQRNAPADIAKALSVDVSRGNLATMTEVTPGDHEVYVDEANILFGTWTMVRITTNIDATNPYLLR